MTKLKDLYNKCPYTYYLYSTLDILFSLSYLSIHLFILFFDICNLLEMYQ